MKKPRFWTIKYMIIKALLPKGYIVQLISIDSIEHLKMEMHTALDRVEKEILEAIEKESGTSTTIH